MKRRLTPFLSFSVALSMALAACSSIDCPVQNTVYTVYHLYGPGDEQVSLLDTLSIHSSRANGSDTTLLNRAVGVSSFELPIGYTNPEDTLLFQVNDSLWTVTDTIWIKKENYPHFESVDCSAAFFHLITGVRSTHRIIDSIVINNPHVNYDATNEHFHLYLKAGE